jgi:hypothetical protein
MAFHRIMGRNPSCTSVAPLIVLSLKLEMTHLMGTLLKHYSCRDQVSLQPNRSVESQKGVKGSFFST